MNHSRPPIPVIVVVLTMLGIVGYFLYTQVAQQGDTTLRASGTVEAVQVKIGPEIGGKVLVVEVEQGQAVRAGDVLFRLDATLLTAQREAASAALDTAKAAVATSRAAAESARAQYDLALSVALAEEQAGRTLDWRTASPADFDQPGWYFTRNEQITALQAEVTSATDSLSAAEANLGTVVSQAGGAEFTEAEQTLLEARTAYLAARDVLTRTNNATDGQALRDAAQTALDEAQANLNDAQDAYDDLLENDVAEDILDARAEVRIGQERLQAAQDSLRLLQTGLLSPRVNAAQKVLEQTLAAVAQAELAVAQAEAQLALLDAQITKLTILAPSDGVVLARNIEPGEVLPAGAAALSLARLSDLTITVYVPENRYGEISLGQAAEVTVDSFPGETFSATVIYISDRAEFTPRNVQTDEGRATTVYAIKLRVNDPEGKLKPGMPADVIFK